MLGFDPLSLSAGYILASLTVAECTPQGAPAVSVQVEKGNVSVVGDQTAQQMDSLRADLDSSANSDGRWMTGGATLVRGMSLKEGIDLEFKAVPTTPGMACLAVSKVDYTITFAPTIYMAAGLSPCIYNATLAHEKRHVALDETIIDNNAPVLQQAITDYLASLPPSSPAPESQAESQKTEMMKKIMQAIKGKWGNLSYQVKHAQGQVDTPEDYKRDTSACPGEFPPYGGGTSK